MMFRPHRDEPAPREIQHNFRTRFKLFERKGGEELTRDRFCVFRGFRAGEEEFLDERKGRTVEVG
jgi:hypothetical protein